MTLFFLRIRNAPTTRNSLRQYFGWWVTIVYFIFTNFTKLVGRGTVPHMPCPHNVIIQNCSGWSGTFPQRLGPKINVKFKCEKITRQQCMILWTIQRRPPGTPMAGWSNPLITLPAALDLLLTQHHVLHEPSDHIPHRRCLQHAGNQVTPVTPY